MVCGIVRRWMLAGVVCAGISTSLASGGCLPAYAYEPSPPRVHPALGEMRGEHAIVQLMYATDRNVTGRESPGEYFGPDRTRGVRYGVCQVSIPPKHGAGRLEAPVLGRWRENRHVMLGDLAPAESRDAFVTELRRRLDLSPRREVYVFIHGFAATFHDAAVRTAQIAHDIHFEGVPICYSWPAQGSILSYLVDTGNAEWSSLYLSEFLALLARDADVERVHLMAHSMGTQVLTRAIKEFVASGRAPAAPAFDQVILAAADMDAEIFERDYLRYLLRCCNRLTIYVSGADWALGGSRRLHHYARLGQTGAPHTDLEDLRKCDMIDATDCDRGLIGHFYYGECPRILADIRRILNGESAIQRGLQQRFHYKIHLSPAN